MNLQKPATLREYKISNGKVLERLTPEFWEQYHRTSIFDHVVELLTRQADPYEVIEELVRVNVGVTDKLRQCIELLPPSNQLHEILKK